VINDEGLVAGSWTATDGSEIGFIRAPDGRIGTPIVHPRLRDRYRVSLLVVDWPLVPQRALDQT
jgi:hypothetical protein